MVPGAVDGAWWPQSSDLRSELPDLVAVLDVDRSGPESYMRSTTQQPR
jgi:hypothetical protein